MHLYVHIPFCRRRCSYCDFAVAVRRRVPHARFVAAVRAEYARRRRAEQWPEAPFDTVYLGGGTPSQLAPGAIGDLLRTFTWMTGAEVTLEANPEDVTPAAARHWVGAGVTRISLGVQSFAPRVLAWMHRSHDAGAAGRAVATLRDAGVSAVSLDLIVAVPDDLGHDALDDVEQALALEPEHLSVYGLTLEPHTPFGHWVEWARATPASDERYAADFLAVHDVLTDAGFDHYEVSNYARRSERDHRARHNAAYWVGAPYVGLGPSAHGYRDGTRRWNLRHWAAYERAIARGGDPIDGFETLTDEQRFLERVYLTLRTAAPLGPSDEARCDHHALLAAEAQGWLTGGPGQRRATPAGWLVLDELVTGLTTSR